MNTIFVAVAIFLACVGASNGLINWRELSQVEDEFGIKEADGGKVASRFGVATAWSNNNSDDDDDDDDNDDDDDEVGNDDDTVASRYTYACKMYDEDNPLCWEDDDDTR